MGKLPKLPEVDVVAAFESHNEEAMASVINWWDAIGEILNDDSGEFRAEQDAIMDAMWRAIDAGYKAFPEVK